MAWRMCVAENPAVSGVAPGPATELFLKGKTKAEIDDITAHTPS